MRHFAVTGFSPLQFSGIQILIGIATFPAQLGLLQTAPVVRKESDNVVGTDPDLTVTFLLAFIEDQLDAEVEMDRFNIIDVFFV